MEIGFSLNNPHTSLFTVYIGEIVHIQSVDVINDFFLTAHISIDYPLDTNTCCPEFSGQEIRSTVIFNFISAALEEEEDSELKGPVVRTDCLPLTDCCV